MFERFFEKRQNARTPASTYIQLDLPRLKFGVIRRRPWNNDDGPYPERARHFRSEDLLHTSGKSGKSSRVRFNSFRQKREFWRRRKLALDVAVRNWGRTFVTLNLPIQPGPPSDAGCGGIRWLLWKLVLFFVLLRARSLARSSLGRARCA